MDNFILVPDKGPGVSISLYDVTLCRVWPVIATAYIHSSQLLDQCSRDICHFCSVVVDHRSVLPMPVQSMLECHHILCIHHLCWQAVPCLYHTILKLNFLKSSLALRCSNLYLWPLVHFTVLSLISS